MINDMHLTNAMCSDNEKDMVDSKTLEISEKTRAVIRKSIDQKYRIRI